MIFIAFIFLVTTLVIGVMTIGAAASGSLDSLTNLFYISAGAFLLLLTVDTVVRGYKEKKAKEEYVKKLEEATRAKVTQ